VLFAILQGASGELQISRDNIDGSASGLHTGPAEVTIIDTVPGGAGYAALVAASIERVLDAALAVVDSCECGAETSCYMCLRVYSNQRWHDQLGRGVAAAYIGSIVLSPAIATDSETSPREPTAQGWDGVVHLSDSSLADVILELRSARVEPPTVGAEIDSDSGWLVEWAWPDRKLAVTIDADSERQSWLESNGWTLIALDEGFDSEVVADSIRSVTTGG
jgi:hypothetical protein